MARESILLAILTAIVGLLIGCGGDDNAQTPVSGNGAASSTGSSSAATTIGTTSATGPTQSTAAGGTISTPSSTSPETLPGEPFDGFARPGVEMIVVGVAHDDVLNLRAGPGTNYEILVELAPTDDDVVTTGEGRLLSQTIWYEVVAKETTGWVNSSYLAYGGVVDDVTAEIVSALGGIPDAETMLDLGRLVAEERSSSDVESRVVVVVAPTVGDLGEVTFDVIGLADDAVLGVRLHVFGQPSDDGESFGLGSVEQTTLCGRGAGDEGYCA